MFAICRFISLTNPFRLKQLMQGNVYIFTLSENLDSWVSYFNRKKSFSGSHVIYHYLIEWHRFLVSICSSPKRLMPLLQCRFMYPSSCHSVSIFHMWPSIKVLAHLTWWTSQHTPTFPNNSTAHICDLLSKRVNK